VPSVASEPSVVQSYQPSLPQPRVSSGADAQDTAAASPFAMLLDATQPPETPAPPPPRSEHADHSERAEARSDHSDDAAPVRDRPTEDAAPASDSKDAKDTKESKDAKDCSESKDCKDAKETENKPEADAEPKTEATVEAEPKLDAVAAAIFISNGSAAQTPADGEAADIAEVTVEAPVAAAPVIEAPAGTEETAPVVPDQTAELAAAAETPDAAPVEAKPEGEAKPQAKTAETNTASEAPKVAPVDAGEQQQSQTGDDKSGKPAHTPGDEAKAAKAEKPAQPAEAPAPARPSFEVLQNLGLSAPSSNASPTAFLHAAPALAAAAAASPGGTVPTAQAVPLAGVAVEIAAQATAGKNQFQIRLDPPELGRIDVRLDVDREGNVSTRLVVERVETLDLLRRDASQLERALQQAGLKTADNALQFSLRDQSFHRDDRSPQNPARIIVPDEGSAPLEAVRRGSGLRGLGGGIDIRV
jgi:chemotaxis protein MotD